MTPSIQLPTVPLSVDDLLSRALSDSVNCLFSRSVPIPFSNVEIESISQELQPIPFKWQSEIALDDDAVFAPSQPVITSPLQTPPVPPPVRSPVSSLGWTGHKCFESSLSRLRLDVSGLNRMIENDEALFKRFGEDIEDLSRMKRTIKNELKEYDNSFKNETGRDPSRADKEPMRLLYTFYRKLRDIIVKLEAQSSVPAPSPQVVVARVDPESAAMEERLESLYIEKQNVRSILQEYQARFMQEQGRRIKYHRDIVSVDREYRQYKQIKEEIGRLESLLGRRSTSAKSNDFFG
jgi:hypothetical protein